MAAELSTEEAICDNHAKAQVREKQRGNRLLNGGAGVTACSSEPFPNLRSKPKILVVRVRLPNLVWARTSQGVHTVQEEHSPTHVWARTSRGVHTVKEEQHSLSTSCLGSQ